MKRIAVFGSTGSIGKNTLEVARRFPGRFRIESLCVHSNIAELEAQVREFRPRLVCIVDPARAARFRGGKRLTVVSGAEGLREMARGPADTAVMAITGSAALEPLVAAVDAGKTICLANKEALVMAGPIIMGLARRRGARILPVDSEQSAIWQCLNGEDRSRLRKIYLTASGGPFLGWDRKRLASIRRADALRHPRWKMGAKITVDSATLMNKGLEVIEAMHLFACGPDEIEVVVHPESIIHSMVEFVDGVVMAQLSATDMRIPIQYALTFPDRLGPPLEPLDFFALKSLSFRRPDLAGFPCLGLALRAAREGGSAPCVLNAANEIAVNRFLEDTLRFQSIPRCVEAVLDRHTTVKRPRLGDIIDADRWAKEQTRIIAEKMR